MVDQERIVFEFLECLRRLDNHIDRDAHAIQVAVELHCELAPVGDPPLDDADIVVALLFVVPAGAGAEEDDPVGVGRPGDDLHDLFDRCLFCCRLFCPHLLSRQMLLFPDVLFPAGCLMVVHWRWMKKLFSGWLDNCVLLRRQPFLITSEFVA